MASDVYFSDLRTDFGNNLLDKLNRVMKEAGIENIDFKDHYAAIKLHFGEPGNLAFLRPNWAKCVADEVRKLGGKPFLTDCNTLYVGGRKNALDHLDSANLNGYSGALKNIGMGCGSRRGKMEMHASGKPVVEQEKCIGCRKCAKICAHEGPVFENGKCHIDHDRCVGCGRCIAICPKDAIHEGTSSSNDLLNCKMMEYAKAVLQGRPSFHIAIAIDISPNCDCHSENDAPIVPNIGIFASFDPVALDQACADAVNSMPENPNTMLSTSKHELHDHFDDVHPDTNWKQGLEYAESIGLGTREYNLIKVK